MLMNDQEKVHYLANVLLVAFADKSLSARETAALEEVRMGYVQRDTLSSQNSLRRHLMNAKSLRSKQEHCSQTSR
jgi:hypothetical protein